MTGFIAHLYSLTLHYSNHYMALYVLSSSPYSTANSKDALNSYSSGLRYSLYGLESAPTENTVSQQVLYHYRSVLTSSLHRNGSSSIIACVFISVGTCLPTRCLATNVYCGSAVPAFGRHVTIWIMSKLLIIPGRLCYLGFICCIIC
jgi:hypothetical protein